jgi:glycosyltransferase involved in cell wall biosynthesis
MQLAYKAAARDISGIICVSNSVADSVRPALRPGANITVIPNGVDLDLYKPASEHEKRIARETLGLKRDVPTMLWIGAARQGKLPQLVGATAQLFRGQSLLVGDGPERGSLIEASRADNVSYAGHLEDPAIAYAAADVMIFTSTGAGEGAPLVLLEAAACGVPVLSHYGCGVEAMVTNVGGVLVGKKASELASGAELAAAGGYNAAGVAWAAERSSSEAAKLHAQFMGLPC